MGNQIVKEQVENKIQLIAEVDSTINAVCKKVKDDDVIVGEYPQTVDALAHLISARALMGYASKFCADSSPISDEKKMGKGVQPIAHINY